LKQKVALNAKKKKQLRTQINGKFVDISSADENKFKNITVELIFGKLACLFTELSPS
jgi:excinuclease UvrABC ATPase subunit